ncbi:hypothetical protein [Arcticibacterium luteifluviistationis]|uniref:Uncharacterized protein n=1 Tax=Arcticibacterium luteifluviistationis TaxID=1784714 RepID=A0A2Z4GH44_9BACT|nr:hypothetical protein [Arcticibacterium luteifluviistationis]AWW00398.1 hypothetical protein DJ013_20350 [Arcticibacterium luteifluviistationis]
MKNFKKFRGSKERRTEIEERIREVEAKLSLTKSDILGNILPLNILKKIGGNIKPMPMKVGAQLLATRLVSNSHPLLKVATPFVTDSLMKAVSEKENQKAILSKAHSFFSWLAVKTKLTLEEERVLLSAEVKDISLPRKFSFDELKTINLEEAQEVFYETTFDAERVDLY